jgi:hypothetical protein
MVNSIIIAKYHCDVKIAKYLQVGVKTDECYSGLKASYLYFLNEFKYAQT